MATVDAPRGSEEDATASERLLELVTAQCDLVAAADPGALVGCSDGRVLAFMPRPKLSR